MTELGTSDFMGEQEKPQRSEGLSVAELAHFLRKLSALLQTPYGRNPTLSEALSQLSLTLQRHSSKPLEEVLANLTVLSTRRNKPTRQVASRLQGLELPSIKLEQVKELLVDQHLTKVDLIRVGVERFGIPRSSLERRKREEVLDAIETASRNEESLNIIAHQASHEGIRRST